MWQGVVGYFLEVKVVSIVDSRKGSRLNRREGARFPRLSIARGAIPILQSRPLWYGVLRIDRSRVADNRCCSQGIQLSGVLFRSAACALALPLRKDKWTFTDENRRKQTKTRVSLRVKGTWRGLRCFENTCRTTDANCYILYRSVISFIYYVIKIIYFFI